MAKDFETSNHAWAEEVFGDCQLGDERRLRRLVEIAAMHASDPEASTAALCAGDEAAKEASYRFLRNDKFDTADIDEGAYLSAADKAQGLPLVLAIQDTTGVSFTHATAQVLAEEGCPTGFQAHTTLLVDPARQLPIGLIDQDRWLRPPKEERAKEKGKKKSYEEKESHRWEEACERVRERLGSMANVINVADREADIFEFLHYQSKGGQRFVIRACNERVLTTTDERYLWAALETQPVMGTRQVTIRQRGGQRGSVSQSEREPRRAREAHVELRSAAVVLKPPAGKATDYAPVALNAVLVRECHPPEGEQAIEWMLLTTEPVRTQAQVNAVVDWYAARWTIEEYFKAWKSGCRIEKRPLMSVDTLERMVAITAHVAVRIQQLHRLANQADDETPCDNVLSTDEWHCLWTFGAKGKPVPPKSPSVRWAYQAIGRMGGWLDTKRTGRIGWQTMWKGWDKLQQRLGGWLAAREMMAAAAGAEM
jgi:hypothetical protein